MSYLDDSPCLRPTTGQFGMGAKGNALADARQRSPHSYISPVPNWLLDWF